MWDEVMYNVVKVVDLVRHFSESCRRYGLCEEETFPQNFISIIKELEKYVLLLLVLCRHLGSSCTVAHSVLFRVGSL